jgi:carboxyl-terminal processing protease
MEVLRKSLILVSAPLFVLILVGTLSARVGESTDRTLRELKVFSEALWLVNEYYVEDTRFDQLERGAFQGLAESLDPWSSYYDPARMARLAERDERGDVGILLVKTPQQYVRVVAVVPGSPAHEAEVRQGQFLESIDGLATKDLSLLEAQHMLLGPIASQVKLGYFRGPDEEDGETVELERRPLAEGRLVIESIDERTALLRLTDLASGTAAQVKVELTRLRDEGVEDLVLDLRANFGGEAKEAAAVADLFLKDGILFQRRHRKGVESFSSTVDRRWEGGLVTLVGRSTVGEGELLAYALQTTETCRLVGQPTFGKRSYQDLVRLPDGSGLFMTVAEYLDAGGELLDENGVQPDERIARLGPSLAEQEAAAAAAKEAEEASEDEPETAPEPTEEPDASDAKPETGGLGDEGEGESDVKVDRQLEKARQVLEAARKAA